MSSCMSSHRWIKKKRWKKHAKNRHGRIDDQYPKNWQRSQRNKSLTRYCMMKTIRAGAGDLYTIYGCRFDDRIYVISYREHRRHLYEDAQEDLFPSHPPDFCVESLMLGEGHSPLSEIPRRPRNIPVPPGNPNICMCAQHHLRSIPTRSLRRFNLPVAGPITCWHMYVCTYECPRQLLFQPCFSLIESFINVPSLVVAARNDDVGVIVRSVMIRGDKYATLYLGL